MTKFEHDVIDRLSRIEADLKSVHTDLKEDYKILHGNGHPGLIHRLTVLEHNWRWVRWLSGVIGAGVGIELSLAAKKFFN